jgi:AraC-like DNA-binding protein
MGRLLDRSPILRTRDLDEARFFLDGKAIDFDIVGRSSPQAPFEARLNGIYLPCFWLGYIEYGAPAVARVLASRGDYWIYLPLEGGLEVAVGDETFPCRGRHAVVTSPGREHTLRTEPASKRISVSIKAETMARHVSSLVGEPIDGPIDFAPRMELDSGMGRSLARLLWLAAIELDGRDELRPNALVTSEFENFVMTRLLLSHPHSRTQLLQRRQQPIAPRDVKRALDFIHANLHAPIAIADLTAVTGVAGRTLFKHFRAVKGVPPLRYLRNLRLDRVREELGAGNETSVTEVATRWGFWHLGRFSLEYRRRFGESPSETLGRRRRNRAESG